MSYKNLTRAMRKEFGRNKRLKNINPDEWGFKKNSPEFIELINKSTEERFIINKAEYNIRSF